MKRTKRNDRKKRRYTVTWTKNITRILLIVGVIGGIVPYILSAFDKQPVESIGIAWITEIVAVCLGYFVRGYKDTHAEELMKYERELAGLGMSDICGGTQEEQSEEDISE